MSGKLDLVVTVHNLGERLGVGLLANVLVAIRLSTEADIGSNNLGDSVAFNLDSDSEERRPRMKD